MKKSIQHNIKLGGSILILGIIFIVLGIIMGAKIQWPINKSSLHSHINKSSSHSNVSPVNSILDKFNSMDISAYCSNINIIESDKFALEYYLYYENAATKPEYSVNNGKLIFKENRYINFCNQGTSTNNKNYINIFIPQNTSLDVVKLDSQVGDIRIGKINCNNCNINLSVGDINISDCQWAESNIFTDTGDIDIRGKMLDKNQISTDTGDIDICGKILGKNQISTNTGDINISTPLSKDDYSGNIHTDVGEIINNSNGASHILHSFTSDELILNSNTSNTLDLNTNVGDINLQFNK